MTIYRKLTLSRIMLKFFVNPSGKMEKRVWGGGDRAHERYPLSGYVAPKCVAV